MASTKAESKNNGNRGVATGNVALEACDQPCVPSYQKNTNPNVKKVCDPSLLTNSLCFVEKDIETIFFEAIDWKTLKDNIDIYMYYFLEELNKDEALARMIQNVYKFGPVPNEKGATIRRFGSLGFTINRNANFSFCDNLIIKITLSSGKRTQELSHISLHSRLPVYYRDTRRSRSGCGYYQKGVPHTGQQQVGKATRGSAAAGANGEEDKLGPFHYQIDTLFWRYPTFDWSTKDVPFVRYNPDPEHPGYFLRSTANFQENIYKHPFDMGEEKRLPQNLVEAFKEKAKETTVQYFKNQGKSLKGEGEAALVKSNFSKKEKEILQALKREALEKGLEDPNTKGYSAKSIASFIDELNNVHKTISLKFLTFWNTKMLLGFVEAPNKKRAGYTGFPPILRERQRQVEAEAEAEALSLRTNGLASRSSSGKSVSSKERLPGALKDKPVILSASDLGANKPVYTGFFLANDVADKLFAVVNEIMAKQDPEFQHRPGYILQAGHVTMAFGKDISLEVFQRIKDMYPENPVPLSITSIVYGNINGKPLVAVKVALPPGLAALSENPNPHITVYHDSSVKPVMSNELLKDSPPLSVTDKNEIPFEMGFPASVGIFVSVAKKGGTRKAKRYIRTRKSRTHKH
jgi:hypothetical protein